MRWHRRPPPSSVPACHVVRVMCRIHTMSTFALPELHESLGRGSKWFHGSAYLPRCCHVLHVIKVDVVLIPVRQIRSVVATNHKLHTTFLRAPRCLLFYYSSIEQGWRNGRHTGTSYTLIPLQHPRRDMSDQSSVLFVARVSGVNQCKNTHDMWLAGMVKEAAPSSLQY